MRNEGEQHNMLKGERRPRAVGPRGEGVPAGDGVRQGIPGGDRTAMVLGSWACSWSCEMSRSLEGQSPGQQQDPKAQLRAGPQSCPQRPQIESRQPETKDVPSLTALQTRSEQSMWEGEEGQSGSQEPLEVDRPESYSPRARCVPVSS